MPKLINASQAKVIETIFKNPGINLTGIIEKTKLSPNYVSNYVNFLSKKNILREERLEKKRVYLRRFFLNLKSSLGKNIFTLFKEEEKEFFFKKYPKLTPILSQLSELKGIEFIV
ncbi:MAG: winged helix-turn-helix transcriptional regulator, partial [Nanoarchaeota archaeon]